MRSSISACPGCPDSLPSREPTADLYSGVLMPEHYLAKLLNSRPEFEKHAETPPDAVYKTPYLPESDDLALICRLGDPELLSCSVFRPRMGSGGVFVIRDGDGALFSVEAGDNLTFAAVMGYFAKLVANCRYAADIFENLDDPDE